MSRGQACGRIDPILQPKPGSWMLSNDTKDVINGESNFVIAFSTSSEDFLAQSYQDLHHFQEDKNQTHGSGHPVLSQGIPITPSISPNDIISGRDMDSMVEAPFLGQVLVHRRPSPNSQPKSTIQTRHGRQAVTGSVDPRQPMDQDLPIPKQHPTAEDWQAYRHIFIQHYIIENKTLKEVVGIMRKQYHFQASPRMFKHRIKEWGLGKNYTAAERKHLAQIIKYYEGIGETCPKKLLIRGQPVKAHRIQRDYEREQLTPNQLLELHQLDQDIKSTKNSQVALEDIRKRLALSLTPVLPLTTPPSQRHTEIILLQTKLYCESHIQLLVRGTTNDDDTISPAIFCHKIDIALSSLERGQQKEGWRMLHEASDSVRSLFASKHKSILRFLLRFAPRWYKCATPALFKVLWTHISDMASAILSHNSPIALVCVSITRMGSEYEVCETAFGLMLSEFEQSLGPSHEKALEIKDLYRSLLLESGNFDAAELLQRQLLHHYECINEYSQDSVWEVYGLGLVLEKKGDFQGAEEAYRGASLRGRICNGEKFPLRSDIYVLQHLVRMLSRRNEYAECERLLEEVLDMCLENNGGPSDCRMEHILEELDEIAWQQGRITEADILGLEFTDEI